MATIRIYHDERKGDRFPPTCVKCGLESETTSTQNFTWVPPWVIIIILGGLLPWLIVMMILRKSMQVTLPVCLKHRSHWLNRKLFVWLGLLFWVAFGIALIAAWDSLEKDLASAGLGIFIFGGLAWLLAAALYGNSGIRPAIITDDYIDLARVHKSFADEWEAISDEEAAAHKKRKKKRARDEFDD